MKKIILLFTASIIFWSALVFASPLLNQWAGSGMDADKFFCEYGDGEITVVYGNQNCPSFN